MLEEIVRAMRNTSYEDWMLTAPLGDQELIYRYLCELVGEDKAAQEWNSKLNEYGF